MTLNAHAARKAAREQIVVANASDHTGAPAPVAAIPPVRPMHNLLP
jgi:hypothetical protein